MRVARSLALLGAVGILVLPPAAGAARKVAAAGRGQAVTAESGGQRPPDRPRLLPLRPTSEAALDRAKEAAERRRARRESSRSQPRVGVFGGLNQPGMSAGQAGGAVPPDTTGSIGPSHYVEMVNDAVAVYSRASLGLVSGPLDLEAFMAAPSGTLMTDPQIQWDQQSQRWFYVGLAFRQNVSGTVIGPNFLQIGFSRTSNPSNLSGSNWCRYSLPNGSSGGQNLLDDYPKLGHDDLHILIGSNVFNEDEDFLTARIWSLGAKPGPGSIGSCPSLTFTAFGSPASPLRSTDNNMVSTPVPANNSDGSSAGYVVAADDPLETGNTGARNQVMAWHVGGGGVSPTLVQDGNIGVASYDVPPFARQPLPGGELDTLDGRLTMAVADADPGAGGQKAVWTEHTIDPGNGTVVMRWYELLPAAHSARQQGNISSPSNDVFNGAVSPAVNGDLAGFNYNVSGPSLSPQIRARVRGPSLPPGRTGGELLVGSSSAPAQDFSCIPGPCRWGDYAGASPDHSNANVVWGSSQAVGSPSFVGDPAWTTRNFAITDRPPSASFSVAPSSPSTRSTLTLTSTSSDPDGGALSQTWDLDGDGSFDDAGGGTARKKFTTAGSHPVGLRVADSEGLASATTRTLKVRDKTPPKVTLIVKKVFRIRTAIRRGVRFKVRSNEAGRIRARLVVSRKRARKLKLVSKRFRKRTFTIGKGSARLRKAGTKRVKVKLTRRAKRALRRVRRGHSVRAQLQVRVKDRAGNSTLKKKRIRLRR
jgi:hypothetical protein